MMQGRVRSRASGAIVALGLLVCFAAPAATAVVEIFEGDSFEQAAEALGPGDTLIVHEGTYSESATIRLSVQGTAGSPVLITGAAGENKPHITRPSGASRQNTINILGASYLTIKNLEISSNGGDGFKMEDEPSYITLENLHIHDVDVGVNCRSDMHHITVRGNHIHDTGVEGDTGEGMYIGCNNSACVVRDSVIEGNWIHDTFEGRQGDGIELKAGSHSNVIRDNVIYNTRYPCILVYGTSGGARNVVEGNALWNCGDSGIQAAADAIIRNNIILNSPSRAFNSQEHQGVTPNNLEFVHNTIVGADECLQLDDWANKQGMVLANNALYCESGGFDVSNLDGVEVSGNVIVPTTSQLPSNGYVVGRSAAQDFIDAAGRNVYPTADSPLINAGDPAHATAVDFNGTPRSGTPDAGAYTRTAGQNPGWMVVPGFKDSTPAPTEPPQPPTNLTVQ